MREPPSDRVRYAFGELTDSIDPLLRPPGVASVRDTVRRRRRGRIGGAAATVLAVAGVITLVRLPLVEQPTLDLADPPGKPVVTMSPGQVLPPFAPPTPAPTPTRTSTARATIAPGDDGPARTSSPATPQAGPQHGPAHCTSVVTATATGSRLVIAAGPVCPGDEIVVSWATYETKRDGSHTLFASERRTLTEDDPRVTTTLRESPTCVGPWYALRADPPIPATIAADEAEPFPSSAVLASEDGEICLN